MTIRNNRLAVPRCCCARHARTRRHTSCTPWKRSRWCVHICVWYENNLFLIARINKDLYFVWSCTWSFFKQYESSYNNMNIINLDKITNNNLRDAVVKAYSWLTGIRTGAGGVPAGPLRGGVFSEPGPHPAVHGCVAWSHSSVFISKVGWIIYWVLHRSLLWLERARLCLIQVCKIKKCL